MRFPIKLLALAGIAWTSTVSPSAAEDKLYQPIKPSAKPDGSTMPPSDGAPVKGIIIQGGKAPQQGIIIQGGKPTPKDEAKDGSKTRKDGSIIEGGRQ